MAGHSDICGLREQIKSNAKVIFPDYGNLEVIVCHINLNSVPSSPVNFSCVGKVVSVGEREILIDGPPVSPGFGSGVNYDTDYATAALQLLLERTSVMAKDALEAFFVSVLEWRWTQNEP